MGRAPEVAAIMNQIMDRIFHWAPTVLLVGIFTALFESLEEGDLTSMFILVLSLAAAAVVLRTHRALTRGEVRADITVGIRAMVKPECLNQERPVELPEFRNIKPDPHPVHPTNSPPTKTIRSSGSTIMRSPQDDMPTDPGTRKDSVSDEEWRQFKEGPR